MKPLSYAWVKPPELIRHNGLRSVTFDDIYFMPETGVEESRYVFIEGNKLCDQWKSHKKGHYTVAETGFGSGLNLMVLLEHWSQHSHKPKHLHFISCELHPLTKQQLSAFYQRILQIHPQWQQWVDVLLAQWPSRRVGCHRIHLLPGVDLTLLWGDAAENLSMLEAQVDAWFLDGFDPKKNPAMWSDDLFDQVARLSNPQTSVATFTAASQIRRQLERTGFEVCKRKGFGRKREMITARKVEQNKTLPKQLWAPLPHTPLKKVAIIGAGIAGGALAHAFVRAGVPVTLFDPSHPMQGASGNPAALVMPYLTAQASPEALLYWRAFEYALCNYPHFHQVGVKEWCLNSKRLTWMQGMQTHPWPDDLLSFHEASVTHRQAGWVEPSKLWQAWHVDAVDWQQAGITKVEQSNGQWHLFGDGGVHLGHFEVLVVAAGMGCRDIEGLPQLPLTAKHGQTTVFEALEPHTENTAIKADGYAIPLPEQRWLLGASFDHLEEPLWSKPAQLDAQHGQKNLAMWSELKAIQPPVGAVVSGHAGIRATTPDHLPLCGPIVDAAQFRTDYADLHHGRHWQSHPPAKTIDGLYVLTGLGSRGFTSAPLLAQVLVDMVLGRPMPLERRLLEAIHPNRFLYRAMKTPKHGNGF